MSRISSLGASNSLVTQILETQERLFVLEQQVASEKKSQDYGGIAADSERLVNLENTNSQLQSYIDNNQIENLRLNLTTTTLDTIRDVMEDFKSQLQTYGTGNREDATKVDNMQKFAFQSLQTMEALLNSEADGRYLYGGSRLKTEPVDLRLTNITDFQTKYDGALVTYPTTRDAHINDTVVDENPTTGAANFLSFARDNGAIAPTAPLSRITATGNAFANYKVGSTITLAGTGTANNANNGTFTIAAVTATTIDLVTEMFTDEALPLGGVVTDAAGNVLGDSLHGGLTFARSDAGTPERSTVTSTAANAFVGLAVGSTFTVSGAVNPSNNGTFTVQANTGTAITIETQMLTDYGTAATTRYFDRTGALTFADNTPNQDTVAAAAGTFVDANGVPLAIGSQITFAGAANAANNGTFTVTAVSSDTSTLTLRPTTGVSIDAGFVAEVSPALTTAQIDASVGTITAGGFYNGDEVAQTHRVSDLRSFEKSLTAIDPAFEKAIRAMGLIAQGAFGKEGGLDQNTNRADQAMYLITSSLETTVAGTAPFGTELTGNLEDVERTIGFNQVVIDRTTQLQKDFSAFLDSRIAGLENADPLETITKLLDDQRTLEASFQTFSRLRQLSLTNFI